jgi:hypothetical protein
MDLPLKYVGQTGRTFNTRYNTYTTLEVKTVTPDTQTTY